jgi:glucose-1-phosphate cytidylyltransferase
MYAEGDDVIWERQPIERLAREGQLMAFQHNGFWRCMDTVRDVQLLESYWGSGAPWKTW